MDKMAFIGPGVKGLPVFCRLLVALSLCVVAPVSGLGPEEYLCEDIGSPFFKSEAFPGAPGKMVPGRPQSIAKAFSAAKPAGLKRVFIVGESAAMQLGFGDERRDIDLINCGMGGYESYRIAEVFRETLEYSPDLEIVLSGNNEGLPVNCAGAGFEFRRRYLRLLERSYGINTDRRAAYCKATVAVHERRLAGMAAAAKRKKVPVLFCPLPVNLKMPPSGLPPEGPDVAAGRAALEAGNYAAALGRFGSASASDPFDPFVQFYMGRAMEGLKRFGQAREHYIKAVELDMRQDRASRSRNKIVRKVASSAGVCIADLERLFYAVSKDGIPGFEQFVDNVHWRPEYRALVWAEIKRSLELCGLKGFEGLPSLPAPEREGNLKRLLSSAVSYMDPAVSPELRGAGESDGSLSEKALAMLEFISKKDPRIIDAATGSENGFRALFIKNFWSEGTAGALGELWPVFLIHAAESARRGRDPKKALERCERAIALAPRKSYFRIVKALSLAGAGKRSEAADELKRAGSSPGLKERSLSAARAYGLTF